MTKVLFVSGGNLCGFGIPQLIVAQGESLIKQGLKIEYYPIKGQGLQGYLKNIRKLRKYIKNNNYDIIHAHFSFSGLIAKLASPKTPLVVSLLGSDVNSNTFVNRMVLRLLMMFKPDEVIVKSEEMAKKTKKFTPYVVPNGVDLELFKPMCRTECKRILNWSLDKKQVLFVANPNRFVKNFKLTEAAFNIVAKDCELHYLDSVKHKDIPIYFNASDLIVLSSFSEGSPNVIKEAMACNRPILSTDVGDVRWLFGDIEGHFISNFEVESFAEKMKEALKYSEIFKNTQGRNKIIELGLSSEQVAERIIDLYMRIFKNNI